MDDDGTLQQPAVAGEHDAPLVVADLGKLCVRIVAAVEGVEAEHPQQAGQPPQVPVQHKAACGWVIAEAPQAADVQRREARIDADAVPRREPHPPAHCLPVHEDQVDLRMGNAEGLDGVLHTSRRAQREPEEDPPSAR